MQVQDLKLNDALNKLKHRSTGKVNFKIDSNSEHILYIYTNSGCGQPDSISEVHLKKFFQAIKASEQAV